MLLSASTFLVAVSAGPDVVRPAIGAMNDGSSWASAAMPNPSVIDIIAAQAQRLRSDAICMVTLSSAPFGCQRVGRLGAGGCRSVDG
jgi:hypothetical protein